MELMKDNRRPIEEPSHSVKYAPHAKNSDIGTKKDAWLPTKLPQNTNETSDLLIHVDQQADPSGEERVLAASLSLSLREVDTRMRKPLRPTVGSQMEFRRYREEDAKRSSDEIAMLKTSIEEQKESIKRMESRSKRKSSTRGSEDGGGLAGTSQVCPARLRTLGNGRRVSPSGKDTEAQMSGERKSAGFSDVGLWARSARHYLGRKVWLTRRVWPCRHPWTVCRPRRCWW